MSDAERFEERAVQAERLAADMTSRDHREQLLAIAADWREMAQGARLEEARAIPRREPRSRDCDS